MKHIKRIMALSLCLLLLLCSVPGIAAADESLLSIAPAGGRRGETVTVQVILDKVSGIAGGNFQIRYDNTVLELKDAQAGPALNGSVSTINRSYADNMIRVSFAGTKELSASGAMVEMSFLISDAAPLGDIPLYIENVKLMDVDTNTVSRVGAEGAVTVQSVTIAVGNESCLPGQAVSLPIALGGPLAPSGGEFEVHYNTRLLSGGSIKATDKMGNVGVNLSYKIFSDEGYIRVSWAASEPISELGELCTAIFAVADNAAGDTSVSVKNVKFYDADSRRMDYSEPQSGTVTVVTQYNENPILYVVGGQLADDGTSATVQVAVDGAGLVCGGSFKLSYDTDLVDLTKMTIVKGCVATNPEPGQNVDGQILVSWAEDRSALDNETILELEFDLLTGKSAPLLLDNVILKDKNGLTMEGTQVHSGQIGIHSEVQAPIVALQNTEDSVVLDTTLYDAKFCGEEKSDGARFMLAAYSEGRMRTVSIPEEAVTFDHNGIAHISLEMPFEDSVDQINLFVLDEAGGLKPLSENAKLVIE